MNDKTAMSVTDTNNTTLARPSVLGKGRATIPEGGKVRPGIMVLTKANQEKPKAVQLYNEGMAQGLSFQSIQRNIKDKLKLQRNPMTPKNVPYFTVRSSDFVVPAQAQQIMDMYGEDKGDGAGCQLYSFPIVFPLDDLEAIMPHSLKSYTFGELKYWSDYNDAGNRVCMTREDVQMEGKKARRSFGGRKEVLRAENNGICDPDICKEYQDKKCDLTGKWVFLIPEINGAHAISLSTRSFYSMGPARDLLITIMQARGKVSGLQDGKALFWITKVQEDVSMIDVDTGKAKRVKQYIIKLTADVNMMDVFRSAEAAAALPAGATAAAALGAPGYDLDDDDIPELVDLETGEITDGGNPPIEGEVLTTEHEAEPQQSAAEVELVKKLRADIVAGLGIIGISHENFGIYAAGVWGEHWGKDSAALGKASAEVLRGADAPDDYKNLVGTKWDDLQDQGE